MQMRTKVTKFLVFILFGLLILSFAVWGIGDIFRLTGGGEDHRRHAVRRVRDGSGHENTDGQELLLRLEHPFVETGNTGDAVLRDTVSQRFDAIGGRPGGPACRYTAA